MLALETHPKPRMSAKKKRILTLTILGVGASVIASLFLFGVIEKPSSINSGPNIMENGSFEKWRGKNVIGWEVNNAHLINEKKEVLDGKLSMGIMCKDGISGGISQTITLEPSEIYNLSFHLKSNGILKELSGYELTYQGEKVNTTTDTESGIHYHQGEKQWRQYFGRITGANAVTIKFFSRKKAITYVDAVGVGVNLMPMQPTSSAVQVGSH